MDFVPGVSSSKRLEALRADPVGTGADASLRAGSSSRLVHSVLFFPYPFFRSCLGENAAFAESKRKEVVFEDLSWDALQYLIAFVYDVDLPSDMPSEILRNLWSFAAVHGMDDLQSSAAVIIEDRITADSTLEWFRPSVSLKDSTIVRKACEALFEYFMTAELKHVVAEVSEFSHEEMTALRDSLHSANDRATDDEKTERHENKGSLGWNEDEDDDKDDDPDYEVNEEEEGSIGGENDSEYGEDVDDETSNDMSREALWFRLVQIWSLAEAKDKAAHHEKSIDLVCDVKLDELSSSDLVELANTWKATGRDSRLAPVEILTMVHDAMAGHLERLRRICCPHLPTCERPQGISASSVSQSSLRSSRA